jgi:hypothetical protein
MEKNGQLALALALILVGTLFLAANLFGVPAAPLFWPAVLVVIGIALIVRPTPVGSVFRPFGVERFGAWEAGDEHYAMFVGEVDLDYGQATLKDGVTRLDVKAFVVDAELRIPAEVGVRLTTGAFVTDASVNGEKTDHIFTGFAYKSANYESAGKKLDIDLNGFVVSLKLRHG